MALVAFRDARRFVNAAGRLVRHGEFNPGWVDNPEDHVQELGAVGGFLTVGVTAVGGVVQHGLAQTNLGSFGFTKRKRQVDSGATRSGKRFRGTDQSGNTMSHRRISTGEQEDGGDPMEVTASASSAIAAASKTHETEITPLPRHVKPGIPEYFTTKLVYTAEHKLNLARQTTAQADFGVRVNSIFDVVETIGGDDQPRWRDYFSAIYDYYTVIKCEIQLRIMFRKSTDNGATESTGMHAPIWLHWMTFGSDIPALNVDGPTLQQDLSMQHMLVNKPPDGQEALVRIGDVLDHSDYTEKIIEIKQDSKEEIWTAVGSNPGLQHLWRVQPRHAYDTGADANVTKIYYWPKIIYTVQFKEANNSYKFRGQA